MKPRLIAVSGWAGSGKDTTSDYLVRKYGYIKLSFARVLKDLVADIYGVPREFLDSPTMKEKPLENLPAIPSDPFTQALHNLLSVELSSGYWTPRALCILEGSVKRSVNANFWTRRIIDEVKGHPNNCYIISDLRYKSEADTLRLLLPEVLLFRIDRHLSIATQDPSERDLDDYKFDVSISNRNPDKELLFRTIDDIFYINKWK